jgi:soluble lytic murein transglycosylase
MPPQLPKAALSAAAGFSIGLTATILWSSEISHPLAAVREVVPVVVTLDPVVALPRTSAVAALQQAELYLEAGRPWAAWRVLEPHAAEADATARIVVVAARAAAGWGGWDEVRRLLAGQPWLDARGSGDGLLLLARAEAESGRWSEAAAAYRRHLAARTDGEHGVVRGRLAAALVRAAREREAAEEYRAAAESLPEIADWLRVREIEAALAAGTHEPRMLERATPGRSAAVRVRRARADAAAWLALGDSARAESRLRSEARHLAGTGATVEAAVVAIELAELQLLRATDAEARELLRSVALEGSVPHRQRVRAADLLAAQDGKLSAPEQLARSAAYEASGRAAQAARSLRSALDLGAPDDAVVRFRLGRLLFDAGQWAEARETMLAVAERIADPERAAEAELLAARARFRGGDRAGGTAALLRLAERRPATSAAGSALFLLADAAATIEEALPLYRRAASTPAPEAREALVRLGDRRLRGRDADGAIRAWEEYVARYPDGEATARLAFTVGRMHARAGRATRAGEMFAAAVRADPLSYYAVRAAEKLGIHPLADVLIEQQPWIGLAGDAAEVSGILERLDLLRAIGLEEEWKQELESTIRLLDPKPGALLSLAEGLRDREHTVEAIRLGRQLLARRDGRWDERLLRVVFPFPYRSELLSQTERYGVDPMLFAALVRQESTFRPAVRSRVGATGLSQVMPATGRWIAPRVGIAGDDYSDRLLSVPEVNLQMGALYLSDLLSRYGGAIDLALAGYNAGPGRADRWRRELGHVRDVDAFRDAIPYRETRHYVKIVLRNASVYDFLYRRTPSTADAQLPKIDVFAAE